MTSGAQFCKAGGAARTGTPLHAWARSEAPGGMWNWIREMSWKATWGK